MARRQHAGMTRDQRSLHVFARIEHPASTAETFSDQADRHSRWLLDRTPFIVRIGDLTNPALATALSEAFALRRQSIINAERREAESPQIALEAPGTVQENRVRARDELNLRYADYLERQNLRDEGTSQAPKEREKGKPDPGEESDRFVRLVPTLAELPKDADAAATAKTAQVRQAYRVQDLVVPGRFVDRLV
ncbi:MAG: hypothetical protein AAGB34_06325 [Planctomycetota bacterium]